MNQISSVAATSASIESKPASSAAKMGLLTMMAIAIGMVIVQGAMISATQGIGIGGMSFIAAMVVALVLAQFNAMSFSELSLMFPQEGTLATYTQKAIGHFPAILVVFAGYVVVALLAIPVEMFLVDVMLQQLAPGVLPEKVVPLLILAVLLVANLVGADIFARVQNLLAFILVSALVLMGVVAIGGLGEPHAVLTAPVDWSFDGVLDGSFFGLVALAMWLMVGVEFICPMINEVKDPKKNIPRAMHLSLFAIFFIFLGFAVGATYYLDAERLAHSPIPYLDYANAVFGKGGLFIATVMALAATCSTINTLLAAIPRMLHGMAMNKQAFPQLKALNRHGVPWVATVMIAGLTTIPFLFVHIDSLITLVIAATTSYLIAYIVAHINVIVLRKRMPEHERPYRSPWFPIPQVLGIAAMVYIAFNNSPSPDMTVAIYSATGVMLLVLAVISALWVKFYMKRGLFEPDMDD